MDVVDELTVVTLWLSLRLDHRVPSLSFVAP
jgi:hypothetical protein